MNIWNRNYLFHLRTALFVTIFLILPLQAMALTCSKSCNDQCTKKVGFLGSSMLDPFCFSACKSWQLGKCYNLEDILDSSIAEVGQWLYIGAAAELALRNPLFKPLSDRHKEMLRPEFGDLVDEVRIHWDSLLLDEVSLETLVLAAEAPAAIRQAVKLHLVGENINFNQLYGSRAQAMGLDIYMTLDEGVETFCQELSLLAHELEHTRQYVELNRSLLQFGREYFEQFAEGGYSYENNPMEVEANQTEDRILAQCDPDGNRTIAEAEWSLHVCNFTNLTTIKVAVGLYHPSLSLVPEIESRGWWEIQKGLCTLPEPLTLMPQREHVWLYATSALDKDGFPGNSWPDGGVGAFCVSDSEEFNFGYLYPCTKPGETVVNSFGFFPSPTDAEFNNTMHVEKTLQIGGGVKHGLVRLCNAYDEDVFLARETYDYNTRGRISQGWERLAPGSCTIHDYGVHKGDVYYYAYSGDGKEWPVTDSSDNSNFCVQPGGLDWSFLTARTKRCESDGNVLISGEKIEVKPDTIKRIDILPGDRFNTLTVINKRNGTGEGRVTSSLNGNGIDCGTSCSEDLSGGFITQHNLVATPAPFSNFAGWQGCTPVQGSPMVCTYTMTEDREVTATFTDSPLIVIDKRGEGSGYVQDDDDGIDCGSDCIQEFSANYLVTLQAVADDDSTFAGWFGLSSGSCTASSQCTISVDGFEYLIAQFDRAPTDFTLSVAKTGEGSGKVFSDLEGIDCGDDCQENYWKNARVTLTPIPDLNAVFQGWEGECTGLGKCELIIFSDHEVTAKFATDQSKTFTVTTKEDSGEGSLRQAILDANANPGHDIITFSKNVRGTIQLTSGQLFVQDSLTIRGPGANHLAIYGTLTSRILKLNPGSIGTVEINGLTLARGNDTTGNGGGAIFIEDGSTQLHAMAIVENSAKEGGGGGGVRNFRPGTLVISNSLFRGNVAIDSESQGAGGGLRIDEGTVTMINSTLEANQSANGGGIAIDDNGTMLLINGTVTNNNALLGGGGIFSASLNISLGNSIVSGNFADMDHDFQSYGNFLSHGHNIFGSNAKSGVTPGTPLAKSDIILPTSTSLVLHPLGDYGGPTFSAKPKGLAVNGGNNMIVPVEVTTDQRGDGFPRIEKETVDIGAFEVDGRIYFSIKSKDGKTVILSL